MTEPAAPDAASDDAAWPRAWLAACAFAIAFGLAYVIVDFARLPRLWYHPHERAWRLVSDPGSPLAMGYVGLWLWALVAGVVAGTAATLFARRRAPSPRLLGLAQAWALSSLALAAAYMTWHNWP